MKIGIISDTHDNLDAIEKAVSIFNENKVELVIHAGDFIAPFTARPFEKLNSKLVGIFGNNDGEKFGLKNNFKQIGEIHNDPYIFSRSGKKILLTHHPEIVNPIAKSYEYDLVIYGHTHKNDIRKIHNTLVINPGEGGGWLYGDKTLAILDLEKMKAEIIRID